MSRRQALGVISNKNSTNAFNKGLSNGNSVLGAKDQNILKTSASSSNMLVLNQMQFNDENEPPQCVYSKSLKQQASGEKFEFEIFQEDSYKSLKEQLSLNIQQTESALFKFTNKQTKTDVFNKENDKPKTLAENLPKQTIEEDYEFEDDEEEEEEEEDEAKYDYEYEDYLEEQEDQEDEDEEEEGISRLNIAASAEHSSKSKQSKNHSHELINMTLDMTASPMILDDTIKYQSKLEDESKLSKYNDEILDEDEKRRLAIIERENILMNCAEYKDDIYAYMRELEKQNRPKANYMKKQQDITNQMRTVLIDWLVEVADEYRLNSETLFLAVNYTDRFLSQMSVLRGKLQLVGTACMYIASKYEEITPPDVGEFVYITDDTYTKKQVLRMEHLLLKVLDFRMSSPTANWFLLYFLRYIKVNNLINFTSSDKQLDGVATDSLENFENYARFITELTLIDADEFLQYLPSQIATAAIYLTALRFGKHWSKSLVDLVGYEIESDQDLKNCIVSLHKMIKSASSLQQQSIQDKFSSAKYNKIATVNPSAHLPEIFSQK